MATSGAALLVVLFWFLSIYVLYWVIRLAVRHGLRDVNRQP